jgi:hypothetical protein
MKTLYWINLLLTILLILEAIFFKDIPKGFSIFIGFVAGCNFVFFVYGLIFRSEK